VAEQPFALNFFEKNYSPYTEGGNPVDWGVKIG
jgi:hypothetical protein